MSKERIKRIVSIAVPVLFMGVVVFCVCYYHNVYRQPEEAAQDNHVTIEDREPQEEAQQQDTSEETEANQYDDEGYLDIRAGLTGMGDAESVKLYVQNDTCYFFLPAYADAGQIVWQFDEERYEVLLDGQAVRDGDRLEMTGISNTVYEARTDGTAAETDETKTETGGTKTETDETKTETDGAAVGTADEEQERTLQIRRQTDADTVEYKLRVMKSESLPAIFIDTDSQAMTYLEQDKEHEETGSFVCISAAGEKDSGGVLDKISGRGYSSFSAAKKSYTITLEEAQPVLGMSSACKWVLQANALDLTRMRNKTVYDMAKDMGVPYAVDSAYVDLYFNGEYAGNYLVCEKIEASPNRMDIGEDYLLEGIFASRSEEEIDCFRSEAGWYEVKNPEEVTEEDLEFLADYMDRIVELIEGCDTEEAYKNLQQYIDIESFAQMYLLDELTNEPDLNRASTFYFIRQEGDDRKLYAGPVWDYDRSLGNVEGAKYDNLTCLSPGLGEKLFACKYFRMYVTERFAGQYEQIIRQYLENRIPDYSEYIRASIAMDGIRWGSQENNSYVNTNPVYSTFDDAVRYMTYYLNARYELIRGYLYEPDRYHQIEFVNTGSKVEYDSRRYWIVDGETVPEEVTAYLEEIFQCNGWTFADGRRCQVNRPVFGDMKVYSYVDQSKLEETQTQTEAQEEQEQVNAGYSKRFVFFCMMASAGAAGVCGIALGWLAHRMRSKKKDKSRKE
ncbi:MAG: CotH kinase family protein [Lachnospiraceae bacterium]|nr:CotH kinase family protein [Lachnospiraceae bacterium]